MTNQIVTVNVTQRVAPAPSTLQGTGAFISMGATDFTPGTLNLLTQASDLASHLNGAAANSTLTWSMGVATVTTAAPHGIPNGDVVTVTIAGVTASGYNGVYEATSTGASTFTYPHVGSLASASVPGTWTLEDVTELTQMNTTFWAQGNSVAVYVLELGELDPVDAIAALTTWIAANPSTVYSYLVPRDWDAVTEFLALIASYESTTAKTYFFVTTTTGTYTDYTRLMKCVFAMVEAPAVVAAIDTGTEFSCAAPFWATLHYAPSSTNLVTPTAFAFLFGVTPYPLSGNGALFTSLKAAKINWVGTGAEGGISDAILLWGTLADGRDFTYWYSIDWVDINSDLFLSNAVINGSNNPQAPLLYDQAGINVLQATELGVMRRAIGNGLAVGALTAVTLPDDQFVANLENGKYVGQVVVNAVPYTAYIAANPTDRPNGIYSGISVGYTPARGFTQIIVNVNVDDFG